MQDAPYKGRFPKTFQTVLGPLERLIGTAAAQVSFARASNLREELADLQVPTTQVERTAKALGAAIECAAARDTDPEPAPCGQRMRRMAVRCSYAAAERRAVLGDGAA